MSDVASGLYYDPYDFDIDNDPYPVWKRMRDEAPLYQNEEYKFSALTRWDDVMATIVDSDTYLSGRGTTFDIIRAGVEIPPGIILFEDPPIHDAHRALLSRVFTPKRMAAVEPLVRQFCERALDPLLDADGFDVIRDFGSLVPMRTIGYLLGIPEADQDAIRRYTDDHMELGEGKPKEFDRRAFDRANQMIEEYVDWRTGHPSDDLMTELLNAEVKEEDGSTRRLTRTEVLTYANTVAGAGNETATRLIGFMTQLLAEHPDQRREIAEDRSLLRRAVEETLRYEAPSPVQARWVSRTVELHGRVVPADSIMLLINGSANRDERRFPDGERFDIHRNDGPHLGFGVGRHFCLGASLARLEVRVAMDEFLKRWPEWEVDYDKSYKAHTSSVRGWASLPVRTFS